MIEWRKRDGWIAVFDILGYKNIIEKADDDLERLFLTEPLDNDRDNQDGLEYQVVSDTIIIFAPDLAIESYPWFLHLATHFIRTATRERLPLQGAISAGVSFTGEPHRMLLGSAFLEAYQYCEAQDWIGLLMTPSATRAVRQAGLEPLRHDFVCDDIPWRKQAPEDYVREDTLAYRFHNGSANYGTDLNTTVAPSRSSVTVARPGCVSPCLQITHFIVLASA